MTTAHLLKHILQIATFLSSHSN